MKLADTFITLPLTICPHSLLEGSLLVTLDVFVKFTTKEVDSGTGDATRKGGAFVKL